MSRVLNIIYMILASLVGSSASMVYAEEAVQCKIGRSAFKIGEQTTLALSVNGQSSVFFPPSDTIRAMIPGIEVLSFRDSLSGNTSSRIYTITSFDTAEYVVPKLTIRAGGQDLSSEELVFKVEGVTIDTAHVEQIYDIKGAMEPAFRLEEWISARFWNSPVMLSILTMLVSVLLTYIIFRIKDNKPIIRRFRLKAYVPPHKAAMNEIAKIREEDLWQREDSKEYYTKLTGLLRHYMQGRYGFNALEMTTSEIIEALEQNHDNEMLAELRSLFTTADFVKFAKGHPDATENDRNLQHAEDYIQSTKKEEVAETVPKEIVVEDIRSKRTKKVLYTSIFIVTVLLLITVVYMIHQIIVLNY